MTNWCKVFDLIGYTSVIATVSGRAGISDEKKTARKKWLLLAIFLWSLAWIYFFLGLFNSSNSYCVAAFNGCIESLKAKHLMISCAIDGNTFVSRSEMNK